MKKSYRLFSLSLLSTIFMGGCTLQPDPKTLLLSDYQFVTNSNAFSGNCPRIINDQEYSFVNAQFLQNKLERMDTRLGLQNVTCKISQQTYEIAMDVTIVAKKSNTAFKMNKINVPINYKIALDLVPSNQQTLPKTSEDRYTLNVKNTSKAFLTGTTKQIIRFPVDAYDFTQSVITIGLVQ